MINKTDNTFYEDNKKIKLRVLILSILFSIGACVSFYFFVCQWRLSDHSFLSADNEWLAIVLFFVFLFCLFLSISFIKYLFFKDLKSFIKITADTFSFGNEIHGKKEFNVKDFQDYEVSQYKRLIRVKLLFADDLKIQFVTRKYSELKSVLDKLLGKENQTLTQYTAEKKQVTLTRKPRTKKKSFVTSIILFAIAGLWFFGAIGWYFIYAPVTENNTVEKTATISSIKPITFFEITTIEYQAKFFIFYDETIIDMDLISNLAVGQEITFRIKKGDKSNLVKSESIELVALKVGSSDIITLDTYNKLTKEMRKQSTLGFAFGGGICITLAILFLLYYKGILGKKENQTTSAD